ncbi:adrenodoxin, mitochondrial [Pseudophryne corroboree]|uniref:adrenodoxin, mitochondrial n=1 Tax=Pseudophryne corroboree TaxID=495146 RepID=UPI003081F647
MAAAARLLAASRCLLTRTGITGVRRPLLCPPRGRLEPGAARLYSSEDRVTVKFINRDGDTIVAEGKVGESLLDLVVEKNLDIDGFGACEGTLACSTCHLIFEDHIFQQLEQVTDEEMDMLDLAYGLTETSRLGCQICLRPFMNGMIVKVPEAVADVRQAMDMGKNS